MFFTIALTNITAAQTAPIAVDSVKLVADSLAKTDSLAAGAKDTSSRNKLERQLGIRLSPDALSAIVTATATDSAVLNIEHHIFNLYGDAKIKYEDMDVNASGISYNQATSVITAVPALDSDGTIAKRPSFRQGSETVTYDTMQYNFKSKRAIIRNAHSQYGEGFVNSEQIKRNPDQSIYGYHSVYTTCSLDTPHFGIRAKRIKIVPNRLIVAGSANLVIEGIPTPLFLPFAVFPITETQHSGLKIPTYTLEERRGLGLTNGGYYFYINDHVDLLVLADIYSKGSYNTSFVSTYSDRYHYNGGFSFNYGLDKTGEAYEPGATNTKRYQLRWRHSTDAKARPGTSFNADVNIQKDNYAQYNSYDPSLIIQNNFSSNITYSKTWQDKPFSFTASALYSQNTGTHQVVMTLPNISFYVSQFSPFQKKNRVGNAKWYEKITSSYTFNALSQTTFYDTAFSLSKLGLNDFNIGFKHAIPVSASYTVLRYLNLSFSANYNEYWLTQQSFFYYNSKENKIDSQINRGFYATRDFSTSASLSTRIYGMKRFAKGKLAGIRHVLTPNASFNYTPDYALSPYRYYYQTYMSGSGNIEYRSPYDGSPVGTPGLGQHGTYSSTVSFGLNNNLQIKTRTPKDTVTGTKNITLIDGLSINSAYNLAADSFNWSGFGLSFRTNVLNLINVTAAANFDPYEYDHNTGYRINRTTWTDGRIPRFNDANIGLNASFHSATKKPKTQDEKLTDDQKRMLRNPGDFVDFNIPWNLTLGYTLTVQNQTRRTIDRGDTLQVNQNALFNTDFNLTKHWKIVVSSGYNFTQHMLTVSSIDVYRDLHCWEMRLHAIPFGLYKSFSFTLNVKAAVLQDLKLLRRKDFRDSY